MPEHLSKTQIDRLGDRLKKGAPSEADLTLLDEYRKSFGDAYESVVKTCREQLNLQPTGRPAKSTASIIEKLRRESIRLSQVQDIAGCRIVIPDIIQQNGVVNSLHNAFPEASVVDRRKNPSHGYRAVHVIVRFAGKAVEIQVRSLLQHRWAELSEKIADTEGPAIKYGSGSKEILNLLTKASVAVASHEKLDESIPQLDPKNVPGGIDLVRNRMNKIHIGLVKYLESLIESITRKKESEG